MLHNVPHPSHVCTTHCVRARLSAKVAPARLRYVSRARQGGTVLAAPVVYEAVVDPAQLVVIASTVGAGAFWWCVAAERGLVHPELTRSFFLRLVVVPSERASLAKVKRKGELREYLEDINADETRGLERCAALTASCADLSILLSLRVQVVLQQLADCRLVQGCERKAATSRVAGAFGWWSRGAQWLARGGVHGQTAGIPEPGQPAGLHQRGAWRTRFAGGAKALTS